MDYRGLPIETLFVCMGSVLVALDQRNGSPIWTRPVDADIDQLFRVGDRVALLTGRVVVFVDVVSGDIVNTVTLDFIPETARVCGTQLVIATSLGIKPDATRVVCLDANGSTLWRLPASFTFTVPSETIEDVRGGHWPGLRGAGAARGGATLPVGHHTPGILFGETGSQPVPRTR